METDILIAGLMVLASVAALGTIIRAVARAVREVTPAETAPVSPRTWGW